MALRARKITEVFEQRRQRGPNVEISWCFDSPGSFRLFQQQPLGCRYHRNFPWRGRPPRCNQFRHRITLPRLSLAVCNDPWTNQKSATLEIRERRFIQFDSRPQNCHSIISHKWDNNWQKEAKIPKIVISIFNLFIMSFYMNLKIFILWSLLFQFVLIDCEFDYVFIV